MAAKREDPFLSFKFTVKAGKNTENMDVLAGFNEVTGLQVETEVETFREGGVNSREQQIAGPTKFSSRIVLKRGLTDITKLWSWYQEVLRGQITRKAISIQLFDSAGEKQRSWVFRGAVPVKWVGPQLSAAKADIAFESLELVHQGLVEVDGIVL